MQYTYRTGEPRGNVLVSDGCYFSEAKEGGQVETRAVLDHRAVAKAIATVTIALWTPA